MEFIFIDPSGSFNEGKGHTGVAVMQDMDWSTLKVYSVDSNKYHSRLDYWSCIIDFICRHRDAIIVIESFVIRNNGILMGKMPETIRLIGAMEYEMDTMKMKYIFQSPSQAKSRFKDEDLCRYIPGFERRDNGRYYMNNKITNDHVRDALKHLLYFHKYNKVKVMNNGQQNSTI